VATVGYRYGSALFDLAKENNSIEQCMQSARDFLNILERHQAVDELLKRPTITGAEKASFIDRILKTSDAETGATVTTGSDLIPFINLMIKKKREPHIRSALEHFMRLYREYRGIVLVKAYSAVTLAKRQTDALTAGLGNAWKKEIELQTYVDPSLIGGLLIKTDGMVIDNTIKKHLQSFKRRLA
jgi:F-type H+-transporting ATPase subunit delta